MNKKLFLGMFAAAGMLLATSCSNDELDVVQSGNEAQVTFSLGLEGGIATRAISDGTKADKLVYAVYKLNAQGEPELQNVVGSTNGQFEKTDFKSGDNVSITLAKGQTYQVAFWAQDGDCKAYDTDDLTAVEVKYQNEDGTNAVNNDELRDAFFKMVEFEVAGNKTIDVVLKRPFAQINVGVTAEDWAAAVASGIEIEKSAVVVKNAANIINLLTGKVSGNETVVTYVSDVIPDETLYVKTDATKDGKEAYNWLSMSYILVADANETDVDNDGTLGDARTTLESLQFTFYPKNGNAIEFKEGLNSVPVQRNWRTNILGQILTGNIQFKITIDPVYDDDYNFPLDQLEDAFANGGEVTLFSDVTLPEDFEIPAGKDVKINLNGFNLNVESQVEVNGNLQISNGNVNVDIEGEGDLKYAFLARNGATVDIDKVNMTVADKSAGVFVPNNNIEATINISNTTMTVNGTGHGISAPQGAKNLNIAVTKSTLTGKYAFYLMQTNSTVKIDKDSKVDEFWVMGGNVTIAYEGEQPVVKTDGLANTITFIPMNEYLFKDAMENGGSMTLTGNLTLTDGLVVAEGKEAEIDLAGNTLDVAVGNQVKGELSLSNGTITTSMSGRGHAFETKGSDAVLNFKDVEMTVTGNNNGITVESWGTLPNTAAVINLDNTKINVTGNNGHAIFVVQYVKDLEINVINGSQITGNQAIFIEKADNAVINIDKTSSVSTVIALNGNVTIICEEGATAPTTTGGANFTVYGSQAELEISETFANGGSTALTDDVTLSSGMTVAAGATAEIALDNNTLTVASQTTVLGDLTISGGKVAVNVPRNDNSTKMGFLADNGSEINVKDAVINVAKSNMAFAIFNEDYAYHNIETTINIENTTISGEGKGIYSPFGAKSVNINLTNSSVHDIHLSNVQEAVVTVDATSTVTKFAIEGITKLTVKHPAGNKPDVSVSGTESNVTFVEI